MVAIGTNNIGRGMMPEETVGGIKAVVKVGGVAHVFHMRALSLSLCVWVNVGECPIYCPDVATTVACAGERGRRFGATDVSCSRHSRCSYLYYSWSGRSLAWNYIARWV